jgi:tetratricopeptide (TPR) repeat protein
MAYLPVIDLLKTYFRIEGRDDTRMIQEKVTGKILSLDRALEPSLPALLSLLAVRVADDAEEQLDPPQRRQQTLDGVKRLLLQESRVQPLLMLFEDLHWIDNETQALLDGLVESLPTARLLLLVNYRPEYQHAWGSKTYYQQLRIDALPPESAEDLLTVLLGRDASVEPLKRTLIERTEGNPLFLEESVRTLIETRTLIGERGAYRLAQDVKAIQVPDTVQAILAARIDRLAPEDKRLLQTASVIGKDVPFGLLRAVAELSEEDLRRGLAHLQATEFLYEARLFPDLEYTFKHALTHEVALGNMVQDRQRALHAQIAEAIERLHAGRLEEQIEQLAHHAFKGEVWESAVRYLWQAGTTAAARSALQESASLFERALSALQHLPENRTTLEHGFDIRMELRDAVWNQGDYPRTLACQGEAERLAERLGDDRRRGQLCRIRVNLHNLRGELDDAVEVGTRALEIARTLGDRELRTWTTSTLAQTYFFRGEYLRAIELAKTNLSLVPPASSPGRSGVPLSVRDRAWLVTCLAQLGQFAEATAPAQAAIQIAEATHRPLAIVWAHRAAGNVQVAKGSWATARLLFEHAIEVAREGQLGLDLPGLLAVSALVLACLGESGNAMSRAQDAERLLDRLRARLRWAGVFYLYVGMSYLRLGRLDAVERVLPCVLEAAQHYAWIQPGVLHLQGEVAAHSDRLRPEEGEDRYYRALAMAEARGMRPLVAHCHLGLGKLYRQTGQSEQAREHLATAVAMYREMGMRFYLEQAEMATTERV